MKFEEEEIHLCSDCVHKDNFPKCLESENVSFGTGLSNDNIIKCTGYQRLRVE